jgi:phospholipid-binding lipoprotein MlaA
VGPIAGVYEDDLPSPVRKGLRNFFRNLMEPVNALNYLLQLKPGKAMETLGRFTINSTVGVAGLFDTAKKEPFNLPFRRNGFGNTLGYYGVGPGPFLVVPLIGATTLRDLVGTGVDQSILPFAVGKPFNTPLYGVPAFTVNSLEYRIKFDERIEQINTSDDPYFAMRESYLCLREADIAALKNRPPPRDCSIAALMGLTPEAANVEPGAAPQLGAGMAAEPDPAIEAETTVEPPPLAIIYISQEVVQPIPES